MFVLGFGLMGLLGAFLVVAEQGRRKAKAASRGGGSGATKK
jgi:hypothetical protein